jgi:hypothetical protein
MKMGKTTRSMFVLVGVFATSIALAGEHDAHPTNFSQSLSGTVVTVQVFDPQTGESTPKSLNDGMGRGAPGPSTFRNLVRNEGPVGSCDDGRLKFVVAEFETVMSFRDGSLLFAVLDPSSDNSFCLDLTSVPPEVERQVDLIVTGGTGRFEEARGHLREHIVGQNVGPAELGQITGTRSGYVDRVRD